MLLPGKLSDTTLGDLLGALHRDSTSGTLELIEPDGKRHFVRLRQGNVQHVETDRAAPLLGDLLQLTELPEIDDDRRLGEELIARGLISSAELSTALRRQILARLEPLYRIEQASIRFHAPRWKDADPTAPAHLNRHEFLEGRPRHRGREAAPGEFPPARRASGALEVLGLPSGATSTDIRRAFRKLAAAHHPDRHPGASPEEKKRLLLRFARISRAYHTLTG